MTSITKIFILIIGIIAISGEALNSSNDTDRPSDRDLLETLKSKNLVSLFMRPERKCNGIIGFFGCITTDRSIINPLDIDIRPMRSSIDIKTIGSEHGNRRKRRQAVVKTKGSDDRPNSVMSLLDRSSSLLKSMIRNRSRRSPNIPGTSSNKNTTVGVRPALDPDRPPRLSNNQRFLVMLLMSLTSPYLWIVKDQDFDQSDQMYYS